MTVRGIIARAITEHCAAFRAELIRQAEEHDDYSRLTRNHDAARSAKGLVSTCLRVYDWAGRDDLDSADRALAIVTDGTGSLVVALNIAAKLIGLAPHERTAALVAYSEN